MKTFGVGRFVRRPELREIGETCVCEFSLAVNEYRKVKGERKKYTNFFDFVIWDNAAKVIEKWCDKGDLLEFYATARQDKWVDKDTQTNRSKVIFRIDDFKLLPNSRKRDEEISNEEREPEEAGVPF
jgi:single-strand DNA-binding protein